MGDVRVILIHLATERKVSAFSQNQAFSPMLFLDGHPLEVELGWINGA